MKSGDSPAIPDIKTSGITIQTPFSIKTISSNNAALTAQPVFIGFFFMDFNNLSWAVFQGSISSWAALFLPNKNVI